MRRTLAVCLALLMPMTAAAQSVEFAAEPPWVEVLDLPADQPALRAEASDGVHYLLTDHQVQWEGETQLAYYRSVAEVTDRAGMEQLATINEDFDPEFETLQLVRLAIIRDGERIDLTDSLRFEIFRRETRLEEGIIDGTLTAVAQIPGLRVGDAIDKATILTRRPFTDGLGRTGYSVLEWSVPVVLSRAVVFWPADAPMHRMPLPPEVTHSETPMGDVIRHEWKRTGYLPPQEEESVPDEVIDGAILRFSDQADWSALSSALTPFYAADYPLPPEWEAHVDRIRRDHEGPGDQAIAALHLVQDELRYVSLSVGAGGYFARLPEEVIASGFGDCKDKSLLLRVLLSRLGIEAAVALTHLDMGFGLIDEAPAPGVFDHMIVRFVVDGAMHWVDPTGTHEGGTLETRTRPVYGYALPLAANVQTALDLMTASPEEQWLIETTERFQFTLLGVVLVVKTVHGAGSADRARARWATSPVSQIGRGFVDYYANRYPGLVQTAVPDMVDDRTANRVVVTERYFLPRSELYRDDLHKDFIFAPENLIGDLPERLSGARRLPLSPGSPGVQRHRIEVRAAPIDFLPPEPIRLGNPGFDFTFSGTSTDDGGMTLDWELVTKTHAVPASAAGQVLADGRKVDDAGWLTWDLTPEE